VQEVPDSVLELLAQLPHPVRLPILLALEEEPRSTSELAALLDVPFDRVDHAVRVLVRVGLVTRVRSELTSPDANTLRRVYRTRHQGWIDVLAALRTVADSAG
jgi:DNA-binding transcriptional ArsR family regulator